MTLFTETASVLDRDTVVEEDEHQDRRRGLRVRDSRPVKVFEPGTARYYGGQTEDISATGLRIELPLWTPLREGVTLSIHVGLNRNGQTLANRRTMMPARVIWVNRLPGKHARLEVGVEFLNHITAHAGAA